MPDYPATFENDGDDRSTRFAQSSAERRRAFHAALRCAHVVTLLAIAMSACRPHEGGPCTGNRGTCMNGQEALWCVDGRYARVGCHGPSGCNSDGTTIHCDQSRARTGESCLSTPGDLLGNGGAACSVDGSQFLRCRGGRFVLVSECDGPNRCTLSQQGTSTRVRCDESLARAGAPCDDEGGACSEDRSQWLHCQSRSGEPLVTLAVDGTSDAVWTIHRECRGANHCNIEGTRLHCDESIGAVGEACDGEGAHACSADGNFELVCSGGMFARSRSCTGPRHCAVEGHSISCDGATEVPGAPPA